MEDIFMNEVPHTPQYLLQSDICRLCLSKNAHRSLTSEIYNNDIKIKNLLIYKVQDCLEIDMSGENRDRFPRNLCEKCFNNVEKFYEFKTFCKENDRKLNEIILNSAFKGSETVESTRELVKIEKSDDITNLPLSKSNSLNSLLGSLDPIENFLNTVQDPPTVCKKKKSKCKRKKGTNYCYICHTDFTDSVSFAVHNSEAHGIELSGLFKCFGCEKRFRKRTARLCHEAKYCKQLKEGYKCSICNRFLPKRGMYEKHLKLHRLNQPVDLPDDIFQCAKCMKKLTSKIDLISHLKTHELNKTYVCDTCGRVFTRRDYLNKHSVIHTGLRRYQCQLCPYRSIQPSDITVHMRKHTGERPFACELCPQRCVSSSNLRAHMKRHLHAQDYQCTICSKKFGYKSSLEDHVAATHERSRPYGCAVCGATYTTQKCLRRHRQIKHGIEPGECGRKPRVAEHDGLTDKNTVIQDNP